MMTILLSQHTPKCAGRVSVDLRVYYPDKGSGKLKPSPKGISLPAPQWAALAAALPRLLVRAVPGVAGVGHVVSTETN